MSKYGYCKRGGQEGIKVTEAELVKFSKRIGKKYIDQFIPLPDVKDQEKLIGNCPHYHGNMNSTEYWESNTGSHGWCCVTCGEVIQWG